MRMVIMITRNEIPRLCWNKLCNLGFLPVIARHPEWKEGTAVAISGGGEVCTERLLRGVCPKHCEILRFAQNDKK